MGKFDGILLCSDVDGTAAIGKDVPKRNRDAIAFFQSEGGAFAFSSGRGSDYLYTMEGVCPNSPIIAVNGTQIVDEDRVLWESAMIEEDRFDPPLSIFLEPWAKANGHLSLFFEGNQYFPNITAENFDRNLFFSKKLLKSVMIFPDADDAAAFCLWAADHFKNYQFVRSWPQGVEQIAPSAGKGVCVRWLKEYLGARICVCVGDQENDLSMLREADLAFCPSNAVDAVKAECVKTVCDVKDGALADVIDILPNYI